jgi:hypothetical protein
MKAIKIKIKKDPMEIELNKSLNRIIRSSRINQNKIYSEELNVKILGNNVNN